MPTKSTPLELEHSLTSRIGMDIASSNKHHALHPTFLPSFTMDMSSLILSLLIPPTGRASHPTSTLPSSSSSHQIASTLLDKQILRTQAYSSRAPRRHSSRPAYKRCRARAPRLCFPSEGHPMLTDRWSGNHGMSRLQPTLSKISDWMGSTSILSRASQVRGALTSHVMPSISTLGLRIPFQLQTPRCLPLWLQSS